MFRKFLAAHSFSEYRFGKDLFPTLGDRVFWEHFQNDTCVHDAEAGLEKLTRTLHLTENGLCLTDTFSFADGAKRAVTEVLMSVLPVDAEADRVILGQRYGLRAEGGRIQTEFIPFTDPLLERDWGCAGVTRILLDFESTEKVCMALTKI